MSFDATQAGRLCPLCASPLGAPLVRAVPCRRARNGSFSDTTDVVASEILVTIDVAGMGRKRLYAAPYDPEALALGHAVLDMLGPGLIPVVSSAEGFFFALKDSPDNRGEPAPGLPRTLSAAGLLALMTRFIAAPGYWDGTGCFHRAALYDTASGEFVAHAEDVGRHNCLDRLAGCGVRQGLRLPELVLFLSCRVTASLMEKALRMGVSLIVSRSAVTGTALDMAGEAGISLVGFARDAETRFTVFTDARGRIAG